jgi:4-alpha-glucanotransferase
LRQSERIKEYAREKGIRLIGDLPFFVSPDSSDVWANPELFLLDERRRPRFVAGVPPDYFSPDGQLWGNPVFNWDALRRTGYRWCIDRMRSLLAHVDAVRLDHFRAFAAAWHIPAGSPTAQAGEWRPGPGADFFLAVERELGSLPFIVEDLGYITPDVNVLRDQFHFPGTRVLQFAFDGDPENPHLPVNYTPNTVVYTGTHDNPPTKGWHDELSADQREKLCRALGSSPSEGCEIAWELIRLAWSSVAALAIAPLQDLFNLGLQSRMNIPGRAEGNWTWRATTEMMSEPAFHRLSDLTTSANRRAMVQRPVTKEMLCAAP